MHGLSTFFGGAWLVLREKSIEPEGPRYVRLAGRQAGAGSALLALFGIDTTVSFEICADRIEWIRNSISGQYLERIPPERIRNLRCGCRKPALAFVLAVAALIGGFVIGMASRYGGDPEMAIPFTIIGAVLSAFFFLYYFRKETVYVEVIPEGGAALTLAFRRSKVAKETITQEEARQIVDILTALVVRPR